MSSYNDKDRPTRRRRRKVEFSLRKTLHPLVIPSAPPPTPSSFSPVTNFNINNNGFPAPPPDSVLQKRDLTRDKDPPSSEVLSALDDEDDNVRSSENNQIQEGEREETKDDWERCDYKNIQNYKNLPLPPPTAETHEDTPSSPGVVLNLSADEIEAKEKQERFDTLFECAVKECHANKRKNLFDLNRPPSPETHQDSPPSPVAVLNLSADEIEAKERQERFDTLFDLNRSPSPETHQDSPPSPVAILNLSADEIKAKERQERFDTLVECAVKEWHTNKRKNLFDLNRPPSPETHQDSPPPPVTNSDRRIEEREERFEALLDVVEWASKGKKYFELAWRGVRMAAIFDNVPTKRRSPRQIKMNENWMYFDFPLK